jgi:flagellar basal body-associated protein FliL
MADEAADGAAPKRSALPTVILVGVLLLVEAAVIVGAMTVFGGRSEAAAEGLEEDLEVPEEDKIVEIQVLDGKLPNSRAGVTFLYQVEIYVQVRMRHADRVQEELQQYRNEVKAELASIWRTSDPREFQEPRLETLTRKVCALLNDRFGVDQKRAEPIVSKCVIVMGTGFRVDA